MRAFVTGASGFVGGWLSAHLTDCGDEVEALPLSIDIGDKKALTEAIAAAQPDVIYHLAGLTHVGQSWEAPEETFHVNAMGTLSVLEAVRLAETSSRILIISSAEVYGPGDGKPIDESSPLAPVTPYASSKVAAEFIGVQGHLGRGLDVVRARPFNHIGPGQSESFVVSALARRIAEAERSGAESIQVGNLSAARDFTDVRDVVRAYRMLAVSGTSGGVYNVCSGEAVPIATLLEELIALADSTVRAEPDESLFRPIDVPHIVGDAARLASVTGWSPSIPRLVTLGDVLVDWRHRLEDEEN